MLDDVEKKKALQGFSFLQISLHSARQADEGLSVILGSFFLRLYPQLLNN